MQKHTSSYSAPFSRVAVVGLGKIGLPLAVQYAQHGSRVIGCDIDAGVVASINAGKPHIQEEPELVTAVPLLVREGCLSATTNTIAAVRWANVVVVIVPVLIDAEHRIDFSAVDAATAAIGAGLRPGTLVIYETTLPVGTTSRRLCEHLERTSGLLAGSDFYLAYSPERVSSGSIFHDLRTYPKVVGAIDEMSAAHALAFYRSVLDSEIIVMASTDEAEFVKLIETTYRDVNIALANEYSRYADVHGLDVRAAIAAANTQPYSHIHTPGVGVGGHCIPVYPYFLFADQPHNDCHPQNADDKMLILPRYARHINDAMASYTVQRVTSSIGPLSQRSVLVLGVAYRGNVRETAFTSARLLLHALECQGATVYFNDPLFDDGELRALGYTPLPAGYEKEIAVIILQSDHQAYQTFDFRRFTNCQVVLDGRYALHRETIESLGMLYIAIGDGRDGRGNEKVAAQHSAQLVLECEGKA